MAKKDLTIAGITCSKCNKYSFKVQRCTLGKIIPINIKNAVSTVKLMGIEYLCPYLLPQVKRKITLALKKQ